MGRWAFFIGFNLVILLLKGYVSRGIAQATGNKRWGYAWFAFSLIAHAAGFLIMWRLFTERMVNMTTAINWPTALMISLMICEGIAAIFFLVDDIGMFGSFIKRKINGDEKPAKSRRRFIKTAGLGLASIPFAGYLYGITFGKYDFRVIRQEIKFPDLPKAFDGFTITQFSDIHMGSFDSFDNVRRGFELLQKQQSNLILFTGDLVNRLADEVLPYKELMGNLTASHGKYSVLGNHDYSFHRGSDEKTKASAQKNLGGVKQHHADMGFQLMNNANTRIEQDGDHIRLIGVENWGNGFIQKGDLDKAVEGCEDGEFSVLMSHDPTHWEERVIEHDKHIHLTLSGHTHGLQMGLELMGFKWSPVQYFYKRWAGLYQELGQYLYVNRGFGFLGFAGRVGIPPEITVFTLRRG